MPRFLIHHTGPENPTKAALGFLVAATALNEDHQVDLFLAGDGVSLLGPEAVQGLEGKGTGSYRHIWRRSFPAGDNSTCPARRPRRAASTRGS